VRRLSCRRRPAGHCTRPNAWLGTTEQRLVATRCPSIRPSVRPSTVVRCTFYASINYRRKLNYVPVYAARVLCRRRPPPVLLLLLLTISHVQAKVLSHRISALRCGAVRRRAAPCGGGSGVRSNTHHRQRDERLTLVTRGTYMYTVQPRRESQVHGIVYWYTVHQMCVCRISTALDMLYQILTIHGPLVV